MTENTTFQNILSAWSKERVERLMSGVTSADVERALGKEDGLTIEDFAAFVSPVAEPWLEEMARKANRLTRHHFGRTMGLYVPIYLSNICGADCTYCGYAIRSGNREKRVTLTEEEIRTECETLAGMGFKNVLLLTGDAPNAATVDFICRGVEIARGYFPSVAIEVYSMDIEDYARMTALGLEGMTCYMETYDRETYKRVHLHGKKMDYDYRLGASERAGLAGVRRLSIGVLLGLTDWRVDTFYLALHGQYLQRVCWQSALSISFPRLRHTPARFDIPRKMSDRELVQLMLAMRLFLPEAGFNISTREPAQLRDKLIPLGVTMMSAGSSTRPGGYATTGEETLEQFEIDDHRNLDEVVRAIRKAGYDPVLKDFDRAFDDDDAVEQVAQ